MRFLSFVALLLVGFPNHFLVRAGRAELDSGIPAIPSNSRRCPSCFSYNGNITERVRLVIRDRDAWRDEWNAIQSHARVVRNAADGERLPEPPLPPLPEIDFSREMVVVAALGQRGSAGYGIKVDRAYKQDNQLEIVIVSQSPGRNCLAAAVMTRPVDIALLPTVEGSVVFRETEVVHDCESRGAR